MTDLTEQAAYLMNRMAGTQTFAWCERMVNMAMAMAELLDRNCYNLCPDTGHRLYLIELHCSVQIVTATRNDDGTYLIHSITDDTNVTDDD